MNKLLFFCLLPSISFAQTVFPLQNSTIDSALLLANFVTSNTINISNVEVNGSDSTIGLYHSFSDFLIPEGIIMSTGGAEWALTPGISATGPYTTSSPGADPHLESLQNQLLDSTSTISSFKNITSIEFDFIPQFDGVGFNYIFASTEYSYYTCSQFNDVFGFFLTGPGISGNYYNGSENLAIVPNSNETPVCINSINSGVSSTPGYETFCEFVDPDFTDYTYLFHPNDTSQTNYVSFPFNGYTDTLSINAVLIPDSTYHLKIVIADVHDHILNSAVFLTEQSFVSYPFDTIQWGCTDTAAINYNPTAIYDAGNCEYTPVGLEEINGLKGVLSTISNPITSSSISLEHLESSMNISIYNSLGTQVISNTSGHIDVSHLKKGIYIIEISDGKHRTSSKYIIQ
ncbi:MAG: choice-of-anchor L domain-containing protein [Flavobacteriales bacterium]